jgi:class 3 adenylate cyclase
VAAELMAAAEKRQPGVTEEAADELRRRRMMPVTTLTRQNNENSYFSGDPEELEIAMEKWGYYTPEYLSMEMEYERSHRERFSETHRREESLQQHGRALRMRELDPTLPAVPAFTDNLAVDEAALWQWCIDAQASAPPGATVVQPDLVQWAGGTKATLAVVFTDIVSSVEIGNKIGDHAMDDLRQAHFSQARSQVERFDGRVVKTIGDSVMAVFRAANDALDFAIAVNAEPGDSRIAVRAGLHVGPVTVEEADVNGGTVNCAARVVHEAAGAEVWLSSEAKSHVDQERSPQHASLQWVSHPDVELNGFPGKHTLYSLAGR